MRVCWKQRPSRGRSLAGLIHLVDELGRRGVDFQSLTEQVDTTSPGGKLIFHIMAAMAEFERSLISERTKAGMLEARRRGRRIGRPSLLSAEQLEEAFARLQSETLQKVAARYGVSSRTLRRHLKKRRDRLRPAT